MTASRIPSVKRRMVSFTIRSRVTPPMACAMRMRREENPPRGLVLRGREFPATWCVLGWKDRDPMEEDALEALLLIETTAGGSGLARQLRHDLSRGWPVPGVTQEEEGTALLEHAEVLQGVPRLLATRRRFLLLGIFWALDGSFGPIWHNRGGTRGRLTGAW